MASDNECTSECEHCYANNQYILSTRVPYNSRTQRNDWWFSMEKRRYLYTMIEWWNRIELNPNEPFEMVLLSLLCSASDAIIHTYVIRNQYNFIWMSTLLTTSYDIAFVLLSARTKSVKDDDDNYDEDDDNISAASTILTPDSFHLDLICCRIVRMLKYVKNIIRIFNTVHVCAFCV